MFKKKKTKLHEKLNIKVALYYKKNCQNLYIKAFIFHKFINSILVIKTIYSPAINNNIKNEIYFFQ